MEIYLGGLKQTPKVPKDLNLSDIRSRAIEVLAKARLPEPLALALTGSRVWNLEAEDSDIDILAYGSYTRVEDILDEFGGRELEVTTVPIDSLESRKLPFEMRWDIVTAVPLTSDDANITSAAIAKSLLTFDEANCVLSHVVYRLSWLGISPRPFEFAGTKIYSYLNRYRGLPKANMLGLLAYSLNLLSIAQYAINRVPYPFAKWRFVHLNKLNRVSTSLLKFVEGFKEDCLELEYLSTLVSEAFMETINLATETGYLKGGLESEEACREKMPFYPYL